MYVCVNIHIERERWTDGLFTVQLRTCTLSLSSACAALCSTAHALRRANMADSSDADSGELTVLPSAGTVVSAREGLFLAAWLFPVPSACSTWSESNSGAM